MEQDLDHWNLLIFIKPRFVSGFSGLGGWCKVGILGVLSDLTAGRASLWDEREGIGILVNILFVTSIHHFIFTNSRIILSENLCYDLYFINDALQGIITNAVKCILRPPRDLKKVGWFQSRKKVNEYFSKKHHVLVNSWIDFTNKMQQISIHKYNLIIFTPKLFLAYAIRASKSQIFMWSPTLLNGKAKINHLYSFCLIGPLKPKWSPKWMLWSLRRRSHKVRKLFLQSWACKTF